MVNFGLLAAEIDPVVWGTWANFDGFRVLAALLHGSQVVSVSQTLRRWTEAGRPSRWALAHILVLTDSCFLLKKHAAFKWKDAISGFLFPQVVQKH